MQIIYLSTLVISKSKGPAETLRDIRTSTYQMCRIEENTKRTTKFHTLLHMNRLNKTESAIFVSLMCSLLSEDLYTKLIYVDWSLIHETVFPIKSTEDLKSTGSDYTGANRPGREIFSTKNTPLATGSYLQRF